MGLIRQAYEKLGSAGLVTLDTIARNVDIAPIAEIVKGEPKDVYNCFMTLWDTQSADGEVCFEEFCDYFSDLSAVVKADEQFANMIRGVWRL